LSLKRLNTVHSKLIYENPYWEYKLDRYTLPNGDLGEYYYVHSRGSVMVVPVRDDGRITLVKQFRYLWQRESIEFPSGGIRSGDALSTAKDELAEEAHLSASNWKLVGQYNPCNGITDEVTSVFLATGLGSDEKEKDPTEEFEIVEMDVHTFQSIIARGEIWDGMTLAAWVLAKDFVFSYLHEVGK
jgi:ADP-ribose pyrophosphatase